MVSPVKLDELVQVVGIPRESLGKKCTDDHLKRISLFLDWRDVAPHLKLSDAEVEAIEQEGRTEQQKRWQTVRRWSAKNSFKATYKRLVKALLVIGRADHAEKVCRMLTGFSEDEASSGSESTTDDESTASPLPSATLEADLPGTILTRKRKKPVQEVLTRQPKSKRKKKLKDEIHELEQQFRSLVYKAACSLKDVDLFKLKVYITQLPVSLKHRHIKALAGSLSDINKAENILEVFSILGQHWNFLECGLLEDLVDTFGNKGIKKEMKNYLERLQVFRRQTTIKRFIRKWTQGLPRYFSELTIEMKEQWMDCSLEKLDQFQRNFSRQCAFEPCFKPPLQSGKVGSLVLSMGLHCSFPVGELALQCQSVATIHFLRQAGVLKIMFKRVCILDFQLPSPKQRNLPEVDVHVMARQLQEMLKERKELLAALEQREAQMEWERGASETLQQHFKEHHQKRERELEQQLQTVIKEKEERTKQLEKQMQMMKKENEEKVKELEQQLYREVKDKMIELEKQPEIDSAKDFLDPGIHKQAPSQLKQDPPPQFDPDQWTLGLPPGLHCSVGMSSNEHVKVDGTSHSGRENEDRFYARTLNGHQGQVQLYMVLDGHNGTRACDFAQKRLPSELFRKIKGGAEKVRSAIRTAFVRTDEVFFMSLEPQICRKIQLQIHINQRARNSAQALSMYPGEVKEIQRLEGQIQGGTTAVMAVIYNSLLHVANVGDSRALLCYLDGTNRLQVEQLSVDHNTNNEDELVRLQSCGLDPHKLRHDQRLGMHQNTRSIGDYSLKGGYRDVDIISHATREPGTAEPFICRAINPQSVRGFLVLMSDGLYDAYETYTQRPSMVNRDLAHLIVQEMDRSSQIDQVAQNVVNRVRILCRDVYIRSRKPGRIDDITLLIRNLGYPLGMKGAKLTLSQYRYLMPPHRIPPQPPYPRSYNFPGGSGAIGLSKTQSNPEVFHQAPYPPDHYGKQVWQVPTSAVPIPNMAGHGPASTTMPSSPGHTFPQTRYENVSPFGPDETPPRKHAGSISSQYENVTLPEEKGQPGGDQLVAQVQSVSLGRSPLQTTNADYSLRTPKPLHPSPRPQRKIPDGSNLATPGSPNRETSPSYSQRTPENRDSGDDDPDEKWMYEGADEEGGEATTPVNSPLKPFGYHTPEEDPNTVDCSGQSTPALQDSEKEEFDLEDTGYTSEETLPAKAEVKSFVVFVDPLKSSMELSWDDIK